MESTAARSTLQVGTARLKIQGRVEFAEASREVASQLRTGVQQPARIGYPAVIWFRSALMILHEYPGKAGVRRRQQQATYRRRHRVIVNGHKFFSARMLHKCMAA